LCGSTVDPPLAAWHEARAQRESEERFTTKKRRKRRRTRIALLADEQSSCLASDLRSSSLSPLLRCKSSPVPPQSLETSLLQLDSQDVSLRLANVLHRVDDG